ncbi:MAG: tetratricopeptide repeat protein [Deltaproteobacteria bacterium]|nr:tetratricopeptide repeat protein [Candidatus Latescibacterota bacterium]MCB9728971.1 tetratricopeptide repeat protein [Deltaproteobacteria bacterium]MCB9786511.1 tetratricopeptide repeat protein [Deltaproteobacteria bacterium]
MRMRPCLLLCIALPCLVAACAPRGVDVVMHDAIEAQRAGDADKAIARYRRAIQIEPRVRGAYNNLALIALQKDNLTQAVKLLEEELALHPRSAEANQNMALVLLRLGRSEDAASRVADLAHVDGGAPTRKPALRQAIDDARLLLALARWKSGEGGESVRAPLELILAPPPPGVDPARREAIANRARVAMAWRELADGDVDALLAPSPEETPQPPEVEALRATALLHAGRHEDALALLTPLGEAPAVRVLRAAAQAQAGAAEAAAGSLAEVAVAPLAPHLVVLAHRTQAFLDAAAGRWADTLVHLDAAAAASAEVPSDLDLDRAVALARVGDAERARALVTAVLAATPGDPRARALADALR